MGMDIEKLATSAIEDAIAKTDYITPYVNSGDKEPCWDGYFYAYTDTSKKNEFYIGKVPVQVKGQKCREFAGNEHKYLVRVTDLKNFRIEGGTIYFVVQINDSGDKKIFYNALLPFELNKMLSEAGRKNKITVKMYEFPQDKNEITNIILNFVRDKESQVLLRNGKNISVEEIVKRIGLDKCSFTFSYTGLGCNSKEPYKYLFEHDVYLYAECKDLNLKVPIDHMWRAEICKTELDGEVRVGDIIYYNGYEVFHKPEGDEIHIGKSIKFIIRNDGTSKVQYKLSGNLNERIVAEEMLIELIKEKAVFVNNVRLEINPSEDELETFELQKSEAHLEHLKTVKEILDSLGVNEPLDCENLTEKDEEYIKMLILSQKHNEKIGFNNMHIPPIAYVQIGNLKILLHFKEQDDGKYIIENYCDCNIGVAGEYTDGTKFPTSKYTLLMAEDFATISNLNFEIIVDELIQINNPGHISRTIFTLLEMLKAYDVKKNQMLLDSVIRLADWLKQVDGTDVSLVNLLQSYYRKRELNEDEENKLEDVIARNRENRQICAAANILLGNSKRARSIINALSDKQKKVFEEYPIYSMLEDR
ncbi:MAG: hypothetical protein UHU19_17630 [Lachnospiraceae bacterium]|nr:hypothetical protein [Lachnospiraceae bacterium]